jgi:hypothetical protein
LGASGSGIPPWGTGVSSKYVDWEAVIMAYHHRELAVPADLWMKMIYNM